jgi:hypothetical protein
MQEPMMNGVLKPADAIARGPHKYNEATRKYEEISGGWPHYPVMMFHADGSSCEAIDARHEAKLEKDGWQTKPFPAKPAKETTVIPAPDLALLVIEQMQAMNKMQEKIAALESKQPTTAPVIPETPRKSA